MSSTASGEENSYHSHLPTPAPISIEIPICTEESSNWNTNPFYYNEKMSTWEWCKVIVMCLTGIPLLRLLLCVICLFFIWLFCRISTLFWNPVQNGSTVSLPLCRRVLLFPMKLLWRCILFILGFYWISVKGKLDPNARILVCNHVTLWDAFYFLSTCLPSIVAKTEVFSGPILRPVKKALQAISVDRLTVEGRKKAFDEIKERVTKVCPSHQHIPPLLIFPQGTTARGDFLTMFKQGSFSPGVPVQPVCLRFPYRHFDMAFSSPPNQCLFMLRMLCQLVNHMSIEWLPLYTPSQEEQENPSLYANNVRAEMAKCLDIPVTNHAFEDMMLWKMAKDMHRPENTTTVFQLHEHRDLFGHQSLNLESAKKLLLRFEEMDTNGDGLVDLEEFSIALHLDATSEQAAQMFEFFDLDGDGKMNFREMAIGMAICSADPEKRASFAFEVFDTDSDGVLSRHEVSRILESGNASVTFSETELDKIMAIAGGKDHITKEQFHQLVLRKDDNLVKAALGFIQLDKYQQNIPPANTCINKSSMNYGSIEEQQQVVRQVVQQVKKDSL